MKKWLKSAMATAALGTALFAGYKAAENSTVAAVYRAVQDTKNQKLETVRKEFPSYVKQFEARYGHFETPPKLVFKWLYEINTAGKVVGNDIVLGDSLFQYMVSDPLLRNKEYVTKHELAHLVVDKVIKEVKPNWIRFKKDGTRKVDMSMKNRATAIAEGCADYIADENLHLDGHVYNNYYNFVKPVLNKLGWHEGIKRLFSCPPTEAELNDRMLYYERLGILSVADAGIEQLPSDPQLQGK